MQPLVLCALILLQFYGVVQGGTLTQVPINTQNNPFGFYYYTPSNYDTAAPGSVPVLIALHGNGAVGNGGSTLSKVLGEGIGTLINNNGWPSDFPFFVVLPQTSQYWNYWSVDPVMKYISNTQRFPKLDLTRIYLTGLSDGGTGVLAYTSYSAEEASKVAAVVPVCTGMLATQAAITVLSQANMPLWFFHNVNDTTLGVHFTTGWYPINDTSINPKAKFTIYPVRGHDAWTGAIRSTRSKLIQLQLHTELTTSSSTSSSTSSRTTTSSTTSSTSSSTSSTSSSTTSGRSTSTSSSSTSSTTSATCPSYVGPSTLLSNGQGSARLIIQKDPVPVTSEVTAIEIMFGVVAPVNADLKFRIYNKVRENSTSATFNLVKEVDIAYTDFTPGAVHVMPINPPQPVQSGQYVAIGNAGGALNTPNNQNNPYGYWFTYHFPQDEAVAEYWAGSPSFRIKLDDPRCATTSTSGSSTSSTSTSSSTSGSTSSSTSSSSSTSENAGTSGAQGTTGVQASTTGEVSTPAPNEEDASSAVSVALNVALFCALFLLSL